MLARRAASQAGAPAFIFLGDRDAQSLTYGELDRRARAVAVWLERGVERGERVLLVYPPGLDFLPAFFGCLYAGAVPVPLPPSPVRSSSERIVSIAKDCGARLGLTVRRPPFRVRNEPSGCAVWTPS
jgi:acyl-CoA synthetase (AMP-forming)/AMP-acid ligase II